MRPILVPLILLLLAWGLRVPEAAARGGRARAPVSFEHWEFWWEHNRSDFDHLRRRQAGHDLAAPAPTARWADQRDVVARVAPPALEAVLAAPDVHVTIEAEAWLALGKVASAPSHVRRVLAQVATAAPTTIVGRQRAVLALGLLRREALEARFDGALLDEARAALLAILADATETSRARGLAAVALALLADQPRGATYGDRDRAVRVEAARLFELLATEHPDDDVPVGVSLALAHVPPTSVTADQRAQMVEGALKGQIGNVRLLSATRAHLVGALGRLGTEAEVKPVVTLLRMRGGTDHNARRSAAMALGQLGTRWPGDGRERAVVALLHAVDQGLDGSTRNFALIGLGRILAAAAREGRSVSARIRGIGDRLLQIAARGRYTERPFAALAAAIALREIPVDHPNRDLVRWRAKMAEVLLEGIGGKRLDARSQGAFAVAVGIADVRAALKPLWELVEDPGTDGDLRGAACDALGLMRACPPVGLAALLRVVRERPPSGRLETRAIRALAMHEGRPDASVPAGPEDQVVDLLRRLETAKDPTARGWLLLHLAEVGDLRALEAVAAVVQDGAEADSTRSVAVSALGAVAEPAWDRTLERLARGINYRAQTDLVSELLSIL